MVTVICGTVFKMTMMPIQAHDQLSWNDMVLLATLLNVTEEFHILSLVVLKMSLGIYFLRLATVNWHRVVIRVAVVVSTLLNVMAFFYSVFQCGVYHSQEDYVRRRFANQCASITTNLIVGYIQSVSIIVTDWAFIIMPILILGQSLMKPRDKFKIVAVLALASLGGIAGVVRLKYLGPFLRFEWAIFYSNSQWLALWSILEVSIGIIAGSIITLRPLFRAWFGSNEAVPTYESRPSRPSIQPVTADKLSRYQHWHSKMTSSTAWSRGDTLMDDTQLSKASHTSLDLPVEHHSREHVELQTV